MADPVIIVPTRKKLRKYARPEGIYNFLERSSCFDLMCWEDDFLGDAINGTYATYTNNSGTLTLVTSPAEGNGISLLSTVGATANDYIGFYMPNEPCMGQMNAVVAARISGVTAVTSMKIEVGFNDSPGANAGVVNSLASNTFLCTDGAAWCYDTSDNAYWQGCAVKAGTAITKLEPTAFGANAASPVASTYQWLIVALRGDAAKFIALDSNAKQVYESAWQDAAVTATATLSPWIFVQTRTTAARTIWIDYWSFWGRRTTS